MKLKSGNIVGGKYRIEREISASGISIVYTCLDVQSENRYVIKHASYNRRNYDRKVELLKAAARILKILSHPYIVKYVDSFEENNVFYLVIEYINGKDMKTLFYNKPVEETKVRDFCVKMLNALEYLHNENIIYRDIKPTNIIVSGKTIKLIDFSGAISSGSEPDYLWTPGYGAPEQPRGEYYFQSDIYGLGATLYFLLTGKDPCKVAPLSPQSENLVVSEDLDRIVRKATAIDPYERFQTETEMKKMILGSYKPQFTSIGNYIIIEKCGIGGIGAVYSARHKLLNQKAAIKLHDFFSTDHYVGRAFMRAANYLSQLDHPNIVTLYDYGFHNGRAYLAMEYVDGPKLSDLIPNRQTRAWLERCFQYFVQLLPAIRYAHNCWYVDLDGSRKQGIVHGDIKPQNILVDQSADIIKLTDFMIPDVQEYLGQKNPDFSFLSKDITTIFGTPKYMAPEQAKGQVTQKTDIFNLGATLYELVTGHDPSKIGIGVTPRKMNPEVPFWLDRLIVKAMEINPLKRFQTVAEMESIFLTNLRERANFTIEAEELIMGDKIDIKTGNISHVSGQLFIGKFNEVIANLNTAGQTELADALKILKEAIMMSKHLSEDDKQENIEIINQLGEESAKPKPNRTLLNVLCKGLMTTLKTIPDIAKAVVAVEQILEKLRLII